jgi:hypothetical protein
VPGQGTSADPGPASCLTKRITADVPAPTADAKPVLFGTIMLMLGIPVYVWQRRRAGQTTSKA